MKSKLKNILFRCSKGHPLRLSGDLFGLSCSKNQCIEGSYIVIPEQIENICKQYAEIKVEEAIEDYCKKIQTLLKINL